MADVRFWHQADIGLCAAHVRLWPKANTVLICRNEPLLFEHPSTVRAFSLESIKCFEPRAVSACFVEYNCTVEVAVHLKYLLSICVFVVAVEQAKADTIDFSQFGPQNTQLNSPVTGTTTGGVGVTLTSPIGSFFTRVEGDSWQGIFPSGAALLWDGDHSGVVSLTFATPIQSLTLAAQADAAGPFVQTMQAFDAGSTLLDTKTSPTINNCQDLSCEGTHAFLTVVGLNITRVDVSVSHDSSGFALYGGAGVNPVPIPGALPLFAGGLGLISLLAKRKSRKGAAAFASAA